MIREEIDVDLMVIGFVKGAKEGCWFVFKVEKLLLTNCNFIVSFKVGMFLVEGSWKMELD